MQEATNQILWSSEAEETPCVSEEPCGLLFDRNPQPMWVYDQETFAFLAINQAAIEEYGYSRDEFLRMTVKEFVQPRTYRHWWKLSLGASPGFKRRVCGNTGRRMEP
ncbi:MAG: PAS domain-containing protein [Candidatus Acidiferrales bacterium]